MLTGAPVRAMLARHALFRLHARSAAKACRNIRRNNDRPSLSAALARQVREYCGDVLGSTGYAASMRVYAQFHGAFREGWITDDYFELQVVGNTVPSDIHAQRTLNVPLFGPEGMPDLAYLINGHWFTPTMQQITQDEMLELVFASGDEAYLKSEGSERSEGTARITRAGFDAAMARIVPGKRRNAVVQGHVTPHKWFRDFHDAAVGTVRIYTTLTDDTGAKYRGGLLRFELGASRIVTPSSIKLGIFGADGRLGAHGYSSGWMPNAAHPDSGRPFKDAKIPHYAKATAFCERLHMRLPHFQVIGWDVAITDAGEVMLLELNGGNCHIAIPETLTGPMFAGCGFERFAKPLLPPRHLLGRRG